MLYGREAEQARIARILTDAREHRRSHALVVRGETGIGKSALLEWVVGRERPLRATGHQAEMDIAFAGLNQLLWPMRDRLDGLPAAQAEALRGALGLGDPGERDRFMVGLAVLTLLADLADDGPLLCLVDDAHWLDAASAQTLLFVARRLAAEGVVMLFATRDEGFTGAGLEELRLERLGPVDAERLLAQRASLPHTVRDQVIRESSGNPLALLEFGAAWNDRPGETSPLPVADRVIAGFREQIGALPERTRLMLLVAAAEGRGHLPSALGGAEMLGVGLADLEDAERAGLVEVSGSLLQFRHPLIHAAVYKGAPAARRLEVHRVLAESSTDRDCGTRHRAAAATAPDEDVAADLERSADKARGRAGHCVAARLYRHAAELTPATETRARRLTAASVAMLQAGDIENAEELAGAAERLSDDEAQRARLVQVRATVEFERGDPRTAARMLVDHGSGRAAMLRKGALYAWMAGETSVLYRAAESLPSTDRAVQGLALLARGDYSRAFPLLTGLVGGTGDDQAMAAALIVGDVDRALELASAQVAHSRRQGMIGTLPNVLEILARAQLAAALHQDAEATVAEGVSLARDTGFEHRAGRLAMVPSRIAAIEGDEARLRELLTHAVSDSPEAVAAEGLFHLGQARYEEALHFLDELEGHPHRHTADQIVAAADQVEAAVKANVPDRAGPAFDRVQAWADAGDQSWALALALRCQALLLRDDEAEKPYERALELHQTGGRPFERARTELLYGEWLRRNRRRSDARIQLRSALKTFERLKATPWTERTRSELRATGEGNPANGHAPAMLDRLTPQELQVVRLAAEGVSSREIAAQLFLSPRTVEYHLYKAYPKLGVSSRKELARLAVSADG